MKNALKLFYQKCDDYLVRILFVIFLLIAILFFCFFIENFYHFWTFDGNSGNITPHNIDGEALTAFHSVIIVLLTILLVLVAAVQLKALNKTGKADFISRLSEHYGSESIIKARQIIHKLYLQAKNNKNIKCECEYRKAVAQEIEKIRYDQKNYEEYVYLVNLLDFLEDLAYHEKIEDISSEAMAELMGASLVFYYQIFYLNVEAVRKDCANNNYYCEFFRLAAECKKNMNKNLPKCCKCNCTTCGDKCGCSFEIF